MSPRTCYLQHPFANTIVPAGDLAFVDRCIGVEAAEMATAQAPDNLPSSWTASATSSTGSDPPTSIGRFSTT